MDANWLEDEWRARRAVAPVDRHMQFSSEGLVLGAGTLIAPATSNRREITIDVNQPRLVALLSAAHRRRPAAIGLRHLRRAAECWSSGEDALTGIHLAHSQLARLEELEADAHRLFLADAMLQAGLDTEVLLKALDLGDSDPLAKYRPDQLRVPPGRGRVSGRWTSGSTGAGSDARQVHRPARRGAKATPSSGAAARSVAAGVRPTAAAAAIAVGRAGAGLDLGAIGARTLAGLAAFITSITEISAGAAVAGVAAAAGVLFIPSAGPRGKWVKVAGPGDVSYFRSPDEPGITFRYTTADGKQRTWATGPDGPDHGYRGPDGQVVAKWFRTAAGVKLAVNLIALIGSRSDEPAICPSSTEGSNGPRGRAYEDFVKARFNPGMATPSGFGYDFYNPIMKKAYDIDDCKWIPGVVVGIPFAQGALAEYKGPGFAEHMLNNDGVWRFGMRDKLDAQAQHQWDARQGRTLTWFVEERPLAQYLAKRFEEMRIGIKVVYFPYNKLERIWEKVGE